MVARPGVAVTDGPPPWRELTGLAVVAVLTGLDPGAALVALGRQPLRHSGLPAAALLLTAAGGSALAAAPWARVRRGRRPTDRPCTVAGPGPVRRAGPGAAARRGAVAAAALLAVSAALAISAGLPAGLLVALAAVQRAGAGWVVGVAAADRRRRVRALPRDGQRRARAVLAGLAAAGLVAGPVVGSALGALGHAAGLPGLPLLVAPATVLVAGARRATEPGGLRSGGLGSGDRRPVGPGVAVPPPPGGGQQRGRGAGAARVLLTAGVGAAVTLPAPLAGAGASCTWALGGLLAAPAARRRARPLSMRRARAAARGRTSRSVVAPRAAARPPSPLLTVAAAEAALAVLGLLRAR